MATLNIRKVLLEDYTGMTCPNCPLAAEAADAIQHSNPNTVVVIANHTSDYAKPNRDTTDESFKNDFRNEASSDWSGSQYFKIQAYPSGIINRMGNPNYTAAYTQWASLVNTAKAQPQTTKLEIKSYYDTLQHYLSVDVKATFLRAFSNNVNAVVLLTQDSIVGDQLDNRTNVDVGDRDPSQPQRRLHYKFDHLVIDVLNGSTGKLIKNGPIAVNDVGSISTTCYRLNKCFGRKYVGNNYIPVRVVDKYVNLVVFVYDVSTNEVLQVEKLRIK